MALRLGAHIASLAAQRQMNRSANQLASVFERLSSGQRINHAADDSAGLALASTLKTERLISSRAILNLNDGISLISTAQSALDQLSSIVTRISELAEQAANGTFSSTQRQAIDDEAQALSEEYARIARSTSFNRMNLLDGSISTIQLQAGAGPLAILSGAIGGAMGTGTFADEIVYAAEGRASRAVALGDLNGDGMLDVVTTGYSDALVGESVVRLGTGSGSFGTGVTYAAESGRSWSLTLGDLNGDGVLDLVTVGYSAAMDGYATVRLGHGDGTFGGATSYALQSRETWAVALGDLNGDGVLDMATAGYADGFDGYTTIRLGIGDGTFGSATSYQSESYGSRGIALADLNGDLVLDMVSSGLTDANDGYATVRLGVGDGTFGSAVSYQAESYRSLSVALADVNGDGAIDLITGGDSDSLDGYVTVRLGTGSGTFGAAVSYQAETQYTNHVLLGDLNADGTLDLVSNGVTAASQGASTIRLGRGDGSFATAVSYNNGVSSSTFGALGDINQDGVLDLVTSKWNVGTDGFMTARLGESTDGVAPLLPFSLRTVADARQALSLMDQKADQLTLQRAGLAAFESRVEVALNLMQSTVSTLASAESRIMDADIAQDVAEMLRLQILQKAAAAVFAHTRQNTVLVLELLR